MSRVSIGLPVFNGERYIGIAIESILQQSFGDFELIVSDNGSTDRTAEICRSLAEKDSRIRNFRSETNHGAAWNFNRVFELATGDYFKWAACDDVCLPDYLARCVEILDSNPAVVLCHTQVGQIDENGNQVGNYDFGLRVNSEDAPERFHDLIAVRHDCIDIFGLIRPEILRRTPKIGAYVGSDRVLLAELALWGPFHQVPETLFLRRSHPDNSVRLDERGDRLAWFDPNLSGKISLPYWRVVREIFSAVGRVPQPTARKIRCYAQIPKHMKKRFFYLKWDLALGAKRSLCRTSIGRSLWRAFFKRREEDPGRPGS